MGVCPSCRGMGGSYVGNPNGIRLFVRNCRECEGTGKVEAS